MGEFCEVNKIGRLTEVTINRPEVMNALHHLRTLSWLKYSMSLQQTRTSGSRS